MISPIQKNKISKINFNSKYQKQNNPLYNTQAKKIPSKEATFDSLGALRVFPSGGQTKHEKQEILPEYFFISMKGYLKDYNRANSMAKATLNASEKISNKESFEDLLDYICDEAKEIDYLEYNCAELKGKFKTRFILRDYGKGSEYWDRYNKKLSDTNEYILPCSNEKYKEANTCTIAILDRCSLNIVHPYHRNSDKSNLDLCKKAYEELISKKEPKEEEILETCATIQWLIYQENPFWKGNDTVASLLTKSIMHSYNIELSPLKENISLDFEAYDTDLDDYIKKYPTFFKKYPKKTEY